MLARALSLFFLKRVVAQVTRSTQTEFTEASCLSNRAAKSARRKS